MTATMTEIEVDLDEMLRPPCEVIVGVTWLDRTVQLCDEPAEWAVRIKCHCGFVDLELRCDEHHDKIMFDCSECMCHDRAVDMKAERL